MTAAPVSARNRYSTRIVEALLTALSSIRLPNISAFFLRRKTVVALANKTATVVVFIPPAVDPGDPPISIRKMISMRPTPVNAERSEVLKPAVLGVTA